MIREGRTSTTGTLDSARGPRHDLRGERVGAQLALVHLAISFDPTLTYYAHFRLSDYGTLSVLGVLCAGAAWYLVAHNVTEPRTMFFRVAVVSMLILWIPDVWLYVKHEPTRAVPTWW